MAVIVKEIIIKAPPEKIFNFVMNKDNRLKIWPSLMEIKNEELLPDGGYRAEWVYKIAGVYFGGKSECINVVPNQRFSVKYEGAINCIMTFSLQTEDNINTKISVTLDYQDYLSLFNRAVDAFSHRRNEREAEVVLANLMECLEKEKINH